MATAQYLTPLALALAERGHQVTVVTSRRAYDEPQTQFPAHESWRGIRIYRVASTALGKRTKWRRGLDFGSFMATCCLRLVSLPEQDVVVALTSPPLISFVGAVLARLRGSRFVYWVMDFNPDEALAAGWLQPGSIAARLLERLSRFSLRRAHKVVALDRFMRDRIAAKGIPAEKVAVIPPWSQDDQVRFDAAGRERFRQQHGLRDKFVVMYSGNHSPIHPLDTLLEAARRLAAERDIVFCFIGGGSEFQRVQELAGKGIAESEGRNPNGEEGASVPPAHPASRIVNPAGNFCCLPYQPQDQLAASLSAADVHVVVMGNAFVGLVHPCKLYNILAVGAPVLYLGPQPSHVTEILDAKGSEYPFAAVAHGNVEALVESILHLRRLASLANRETQAQSRKPFAKEVLLPKLIAALETE